MKSRHTPIAGKLARSFGIDEINATDLVAELRDDGTIAIREEPVDRKLKRGEKLLEVIINVSDAWVAGKNKATAKAEAPRALESAIDRVLSRLPIAELNEQPGQADKFVYRAKAWLMKELQMELHPDTSEETDQ